MTHHKKRMSGMVLKTKPGESIYIGDNIIVSRTHCGEKLVIKAPRNIIVLTEKNKVKHDKNMEENKIPFADRTIRREGVINEDPDKQLNGSTIEKSDEEILSLGTKTIDFKVGDKVCFCLDNKNSKNVLDRGVVDSIDGSVVYVRFRNLDGRLRKNAEEVPIRFLRIEK